ncbi:MAG: protease HtpX [Deltaproteobacteria bacterium]|nr:protease HtpX [Deltaproteobacteria bacterium]
MITRILLFLGINFLIIISASLIINWLGVANFVTSQGIDLYSLAVFAFVWGFTGSIISLLISKQIAKWTMGVQVIDPQRPGQFAWLLQCVYEVAKKQGLRKMPEVGIYHSPEINAFATGPSKNNSLVAFSTGLLNSMNTDEIEGVVAHEIAHIANGDMVTMTLIQGVVNMFVIMLSRIVAWVVASRVDESKRDFVYMAVATVLDLIFMILASIVVFYFSRIREYRADLGAAKSVGKEKMIAALDHLRRYFEPYDDARSLETLKIAGGKKASLLAVLFSTHPPLEERIQRLKEAVI